MNRENPQGFLNGLILGAVLGMAFAPASGTRTRQKIMEFAEDRFGDFKDDLESRRAQLQDELKRIEREISTKVQNTIGTVEEETEGGPGRRGRKSAANA